MGIYDRDYNRGDNYGSAPGLHLGGPRSMVTTLIIVNVAVYLAQLLSNNWVTNELLLPYNWYQAPWNVYRLLTYGFLHSPNDMWHVVLNMWALWLFGKDVESRYGSREFLAFYLMAIVAAGSIWTLAEIPSAQPAVVLGASGGVAAVLVLYALNFPHRMMLFMLIIPMPMWVLAIIIIGMDVMGAMGRSQAGNVAFTAHLGGALFGFLYYQLGWRFERWLPSAGWAKRLKPGPKLRVLQPDAEGEMDSETESRVDAILKKIQEQGQDSLTYGERRFLEQASKEYQKKRQ